MNRIEELRKQNNISVIELQEKLNISRTSLYNYETGEKPIPSTILLKLSEIFNVSIDYILCNEPSKNDIRLSYEDVDDIANQLKKSILNHKN